MRKELMLITSTYIVLQGISIVACLILGKMAYRTLEIPRMLSACSSSINRSRISADGNVVLYRVVTHVKLHSQQKQFVKDVRFPMHSSERWLYRLVHYNRATQRSQVIHNYQRGEGKHRGDPQYLSQFFTCSPDGRYVAYIDSLAELENEFRTDNKHRVMLYDTIHHTQSLESIDEVGNHIDFAGLTLYVSNQGEHIIFQGRPLHTTTLDKVPHIYIRNRIENRTVDIGKGFIRTISNNGRYILYQRCPAPGFYWTQN